MDLVTRTVVKELVHTGFSSSCDEKGCAKKRACQGEVIDSLSFLDGSPFLLTTSQSGRVVWDITTWREVESRPGFRKSGQVLDGNIRLSGRRLAPVIRTPLPSPCGIPSAMEFSQAWIPSPTGILKLIMGRR